MIKVSKGVLKAKMLEYFRRVEKTGEQLMVTDNRKPVLKVVPLTEYHTPEEMFADVRGKLWYKGNLTEDTLNEWDEV